MAARILEGLSIGRAGWRADVVALGWRHCVLAWHCGTTLSCPTCSQLDDQKHTASVLQPCRCIEDEGRSAFSCCSQVYIIEVLCLSFILLFPQAKIQLRPTPVYTEEQQLRHTRLTSLHQTKTPPQRCQATQAKPATSCRKVILHASRVAKYVA